MKDMASIRKMRSLPAVGSFGLPMEGGFATGAASSIDAGEDAFLGDNVASLTAGVGYQRQTRQKNLEPNLQCAFVSCCMKTLN